MKGKYGEPWSEEIQPEGYGVLCDCNGSAVIGTKEQVRRIVACVNACEGIEDPDAVPALLEALRDICAGGGSIEEFNKRIQRGLAAIAKATEVSDEAAR